MVTPRPAGQNGGSGCECRADPETSEPEVIFEGKEKAEHRLRVLEKALESVKLSPYRRFVAEHVFKYGRSMLFVDLVVELLGHYENLRADWELRGRRLDHSRMAQLVIRTHLSETADLLKPAVRKVLEDLGGARQE